MGVGDGESLRLDGEGFEGGDQEWRGSYTVLMEVRRKNAQKGKEGEMKQC